MRNAPTFFDLLYRDSFKTDPVNDWTDNKMWRAFLTNASRFVLDDEMSTFLGVLSAQAHIKNTNLNVRTRMVENLRVGARLPRPVIWVEHNQQMLQKTTQELLADDQYDPTEWLKSPKYEGWLLMQHPKIETAILAQIVTHATDLNVVRNNNTWTLPYTLAWTVDPTGTTPLWTSMLDQEKSNMIDSELATGVKGYKTDQVAYVNSGFVQPVDDVPFMNEALNGWGGVLCRIWGFLSTINSLPVEVSQVRASKGFVARGQYRKFLDHNVLTIKVPQKRYKTVARNALAIAHRRAGSEVRGHYRRDWRRFPDADCAHEWTPVDKKHLECSLCKGRKVWVADFVRGDLSVGVTTHDYQVVHEN